jgi:type III restriction enzyme
MKDLRLVSGYDVLYGKVKAFVRDNLFDRPVELEDANTLRNLSELAATKTTIEGFKKAINIRHGARVRVPSENEE